VLTDPVSELCQRAPENAAPTALRPHFRKQAQQLVPFLFGHVERLEVDAFDVGV
jgi:hypothetical protein